MNIIDKFKSRIQASERIIITTHILPDADGIGSQIALCLALRKLGKTCYCVNEEDLLERYHYLDKEEVVLGFDHFKKKFPDFTPDMLIVVDTNDLKRTGKKISDFFQTTTHLFIDHHPCQKDIEREHCIDTHAAATGQLVGEMILQLGIHLTKEMALPLYTAILIDTSSFRYPNVTAKTHELVSELMSTGIRPSQAYNGIYGTKKVHHMHLLGRILMTASTNKNENVAWITLRKDDIRDFSSDVEDTHAFINNLLILNNIKVACMFREEEDYVKMSLRSSGHVDVGSIARNLGGGGHSHSAAVIFTKDSSLEKVIATAISEIEKDLVSNV